MVKRNRLGMLMMNRLIKVKNVTDEEVLMDNQRWAQIHQNVSDLKMHSIQNVLITFQPFSSINIGFCWVSY